MRLGCMGRLLPDKGLERALDVLEQLPSATLAIAGDGSAREALLAAITQRGAPARLVGPVVGEAKAEFLAGLDVLLFLPDPRPATEFGDNLPVSILEALVHGVPVVATRVGALPALLAAGGGLLVPPDPTLIADLLVNVSSDQAAALRDQAREVARPFSAAASLEQLQQIAESGSL